MAALKFSEKVIYPSASFVLSLMERSSSLALSIVTTGLQPIPSRLSGQKLPIFQDIHGQKGPSKLATRYGSVRIQQSFLTLLLETAPSSEQARLSQKMFHHLQLLLATRLDILGRFSTLRQSSTLNTLPGGTGQKNKLSLNCHGYYKSPMHS